MSKRIDQPAAEDEPILAPLCSIFRRFLKRRGLKFTAERAAVLDAVLAHDGVFEVEQLAAELHGSAHRVSKATIYRTIKHLVEAGIIQQVLLDSKQAHYQVIYGREPRDHLVCVDTDEVIEFTCPELTELRNRLCREHGVDPLGHRLVIYGVRGESNGDGEAE